MQVQKIQSNNNAIAFRYNPAVNEQLISTLENSKKNKTFNNYVKNLIVLTNNAEQDLRNAEKKNKENLKTLIIASFIPVKILLTDMVNALFPTFNYREKELESYNEEIEQTLTEEEAATNWRGVLAGVLQDHEAQDQAEAAALLLSELMQQNFPKIKMDFSGLTGAIKNHYLEEGDVQEAEEISELEGEDATSAQQRIELGKSKVIEYIPTAQSEKGFAGLGGMKELKELLNDKIVGVLKDPAQAKLDNIEYGKKIPKGLLLYGPPGTGKTTVVEHLSTEAGVPLLKLKAGRLKTSWAHESAQNTEAAFDYAESIATPEKPVLLMIDDADAMFTKRDDHSPSWQTEELNTFLDRISSAADHNVMVVATTNKYDIMDDAIKSRFDEQVYVGLPDQEARVSILKMLLGQRTKGKALAENDTDLEKVAKNLEKFAIREIIGITNRAAMLALKDGRRDITVADYEKIVAESQNLKVNEELYKTNATRKSIGFSNSKTNNGL